MRLTSDNSVALARALLVLGLCLAGACITPGAPRGRMQAAGAVVAQAGYHLSAAPVKGTLTRASGETVELKGSSPGPLVGGEASGFVVAFPSVGGLRYQPWQRCDLGADLGWSVAGLDLRCALPGTSEWLALSLGGRSSFGLTRGLWAYELRAGIDLAKPSTAHWVPIVNLGASWGRQLFMAETPFDGDFADDVDVTYARHELRVEPLVGLQYHDGRHWWTLAVVAHEVLWHAGTYAANVACSSCSPAGVPRHQGGVGVTLTTGLDFQ
jgi:hypothetical protein